MKILRVFTTGLCCIAILFLLTACTGYNSIMTDHLTNPENYKSYEGIICGIFYTNDNHERIYDLTSDDFKNQDVMLTIQFDSPESVQAFLGSSVSSDQDLTAYSFNLEITKANNRILIDNGFYDAVTTNTPINIIASDFIYMDGNFFYIASISYNGTEYLSFDVGFENIKKMIHANASLL